MIRQTDELTEWWDMECAILTIWDYLCCMSGQSGDDFGDCGWEGGGRKACWKRKRRTQHEPQTGSSKVTIYYTLSKRLCKHVDCFLWSSEKKNIFFNSRPDTSFLWFTNPCKTLKFIVWRRYKWLFIGLIILILVGLFVGILLYSLPVSYVSGFCNKS